MPRGAPQTFHLEDGEGPWTQEAGEPCEQSGSRWRPVERSAADIRRALGREEAEVPLRLLNALSLERGRRGEGQPLEGGAVEAPPNKVAPEGGGRAEGLGQQERGADEQTPGVERRLSKRRREKQASRSDSKAAAWCWRMACRDEELWRSLGGTWTGVYGGRRQFHTVEWSYSDDCWCCRSTNVEPPTKLIRWVGDSIIWGAGSISVSRSESSSSTVCWRDQEGRRTFWWTRA